MKRMVRLEQADIELAIHKALKEINERPVSGTVEWRLIKADKPGEKDGIAFVCQVERMDIQNSEEKMVEMPN